MSTSHTPGPWRQNGSLITAQCDMQLVIATVPSRADNITRFPDAAAKDFAQRDCNARLISVAPELLNLVRNILPLAVKTNEGGRWVADARAALAKAEGRT